jgi:hypothetical protein
MPSSAPGPLVVEAMQVEMGGEQEIISSICFIANKAHLRYFECITTNNISNYYEQLIHDHIRCEKGVGTFLGLEGCSVLFSHKVNRPYPIIIS